ncbi:MAG TPA: DUF4136 domain-containing protein [Candidatus Angelobacter sp.]|jgi:hypothetical protein
MRKTIWTLLLFTCVSMLATVAAAQQVTIDYDHHANFERYHTYYWAKVQTEDPLWQSRITDAVDKELQAKGWQKQQSGGDVALTAVGATKNQRAYRTFYDGFGGWRWGGFGPETATTSVENTRVGTLIVDMYDAQNKQLIWRAEAQDTLSGKPEKNENKLEKTTEKMFKHFPPDTDQKK